MVIVSRYKDNAKSYDDDLVTGFEIGYLDFNKCSLSI